MIANTSTIATHSTVVNAVLTERPNVSVILLFTSMKLIITMSRRFGTGASIIANELSQRLNIPVYDKAYIEHTIDDKMYDSEAEAIRELAKSPCIILGRCASDILKDRLNVLNIFVCADKEDRISRIMELESLTHEEAKEKVARVPTRK